MWIQRRTPPGLIAALLVAAAWLAAGCAAPRLAPTVAGITLQPGSYVTASYRAPGWSGARAAYALAPFPVQTAQGVSPETFQALLREEISRAMEANGLKIDPHSGTVLQGTVSRVEVQGESVRFFTGSITARLTVEGQVSQGSEILFAFQDRIRLNSPVNPGAPAPKEKELLLTIAARTCAVHLLNELLLTGPQPMAGKSPQKPGQ
jgi:hypothetical protein